MNHDKMIAVLEALRDGKQVRRRIIPGMAGGASIWMPVSFCTALDFSRYEFEVVPDPRRIWIIESPMGTGYYAPTELERNRLAAIYPGSEPIEFVEVLK